MRLGDREWSQPDPNKKQAVDRMMTMSTPFTSSRQEAGSVLRLLFATLKRRLDARLAARERKPAIDRLSAMSDRELKDIGLHRSEILAAVTGRIQVGRYWS
jgi:uncharacterized protein YjiS (DUF1127 family)